MKSILDVVNVGKSYAKTPAPGALFRSLLLNRPMPDADAFWAVRGVSFSLGRGESVGIIGRNGSGKSTLLQLICGVMPPSEGAVQHHGRIASLLELGAGFDPDFTGRENVFLNAALLGLSRAETEARFDEIAAFAEIGRFLDEPVKTYSSGMFVRLAFAVASHVEPDILIVDEALAVGDARFSAKCIKRIRHLREKGCTLLFVSHDVGIVRALCDRAIWLDSGRMAAMGDVFTVTSRYMEFLFDDDEVLLPEAAELRSPEETVKAPERAYAPISHWGSHVGLVRDWRFFASGRSGAAVAEYGDAVRIEVDVELPKGFDPAGFAVSISVKDLKGTDLFVVSTADENKGLFSSRSGRATVVFDFVNRLTEGKYLLVIALEDRSIEAIQYFEYIEGAHYFSVSSAIRRFGIFNVPSVVALK